MSCEGSPAPLRSCHPRAEIVQPGCTLPNSRTQRVEPTADVGARCIAAFWLDRKARSVAQSAHPARRPMLAVMHSAKLLSHPWEAGWLNFSGMSLIIFVTVHSTLRQ